MAKSGKLFQALGYYQRIYSYILYCTERTATPFVFYNDPLFHGKPEAERKTTPALIDGRAFLRAFASLVPAFLDFAFAFPRSCINIFFRVLRLALPRSKFCFVFLIRTPQQKIFCVSKTNSRSRLPHSSNCALD